MNHSSAEINNEITNSFSLVQQKQQQHQHHQQSSVKLSKLVKVIGEQTASVLNPTSINYIQTTLPTKQLLKTAATISSTVPSSQNPSAGTQPFLIKKSPQNSATITKCQTSSYFIRDHSNGGSGVGGVGKTNLYQPIIERPSILGNQLNRTSKVIVRSTTSPSASNTSANNINNTVFAKPTQTLSNRCPIAAAAATNAKLPTLETKRIPFSQPNTTEVVFFKSKSPLIQTTRSCTKLSSALPTSSETYIPQSIHNTKVVALQQPKRSPFSQYDSWNSSELVKLRPTFETNRLPTATAAAAATATATTTSSSNAVTLISAQTRPVERISKAISSVSQSIPLETRYRNILGNLLQLKNSFVQRTVTQAVQQKICNQTSDDLLNVIFKTLELILTSIDVKQTLVNEPYLTTTASFLTKVIDTGRYMELIENRKETKDIHQYITPNMSKVLNRVTLETAYKSAREIFAQKNRSQYAQILELLAKAVGCLRVIIDNRMNPKEIVFWMKEIWPLIFDSDIDIQHNAIEAMDKVIPLLLISNHQNHQYWPQLQSEILKQYTARVSNLFARGNHNWHRVWCQCVRLLDVEIPRSATVLNAFLSIVEVALRNAIPQRRAEGYICWRVLLEVLVRHNRLNSEKRLKLMCTPLKSMQARTADIAMNKYRAWWYVICNVREDNANYIGMVFEPFLQFCFGKLGKMPKLMATDSVEAPTELKSYPSVSMIAVTSLVCLLGTNDPIIKKTFKANAIDGPKHQILTETIFDDNETAAIVINACGEATTMLNMLSHSKDEYENCIHLLNLLWPALFVHINQANKVQYVQLIFNNLLQMHKLVVSNNDEKTELISLACELIMSELSTSFVMDPTKPDLVTKSLLRLFDMIVLDPSLKKLSFGLQSKLLLMLTDSVENFTQLVIDAYDGFFDRSPAEEEGVDLRTLGSSKFEIWSDLADSIATFLRKNMDELKELHNSSIPVFEVFFKFLYWPLMLSLSDTETQFDLYLEKMLKTVDLMLTIVDKRVFYKESAKMLELIIKTPLHCNNVNDAIAVLFDDMNYEFTDMLDAPFEMLELCSQLLQKNVQITFQDFDSIVTGLIKYRRRLNEKHLKIIAPKLHDVMAQITDDKYTLRTDRKLIDELKKLLPAESPSSVDMERISTKSNQKKVDKDGFVIVDKVWTLEPTKLTEHQREKMKTRRYDIPALYNDMSRSQDSSSIQEWAPGRRCGLSILGSQKEDSVAEKQPEPVEPESKKSSPNTNKIQSDESLQENAESKKVTTNIGSMSDQVDKSMVANNKRDAKKSGSSSSQVKKGDKKKSINKRSPPSATKTDNHDDDNDGDDDVDGDNDDDNANETTTKRVTREQSRVGNESNRMSRRSTPKLAAKTAEKRKTRSKKALETSINHIDSANRRTTRASFSAPPAIAPRQKNRSEATKRAASSENQSSSQPPVSKRARQTRQSKNDTSLAVEIDEMPKTADVEIKKEVLSDGETTPVAEGTNDGKAEAAEIDFSEQVTTINDSNDEVVVPKQEENDEKKEEKKEEEEEEEEKEVIVEKKNDKEEDKESETEQIKPAPLICASTPKIDEENRLQIDRVRDVKDKEITASDKMETETNNINAQTEEAPVPILCNGNESHIDAAEPVVDTEKEANEDTNQISDADKSYMSTLHFDGSPDKANESSIVTSPTMDAQRNLEFLNDTLNISPIISDSQAKDTSVSTLTIEANEQNELPPEAPSTDQSDKFDNTQTSKEPSTGQKRRKSSAFPMPMRLEDIKLEPEDRTSDTELERNPQLNHMLENSLPSTPSHLPNHQLHHKTSTSVIKCSTPNVQSNQSPVSSKFLSKTQFSGRGAQLLQMINSHKGARNLSSSPIPSTSAAPSTSSAVDFLAGTSSPILSRLHRMPLFNDECHTPEQDANTDGQDMMDDDGRDYLTFSSVLPSPYDSPGVGILKRRILNDTDDSIRSPAPKRKRVSFNFPLSETKEYMLEDENPMLYPLNDSPSSTTQRNGIKSSSRGKFRWKRIKHKSNSAKALAKFAATGPSTSAATSSLGLNESMTTSLEHLATEHLTNGNNNENETETETVETNRTEPEEQVSVSHIREYLEMNTIPPTEDQDDLDPSLYHCNIANNTVGPNAHDGSDANHAARPIEAVSEDVNGVAAADVNRNDPNVRNEPNAAGGVGGGDLSSFSDDDIFKYLTTKYSMNDILERLEPSINIECAHFMVNKMSTMMENSKRTEQLVMEQLAERHSNSFLEYAIGENSTKDICDRVVENSQQQFIDYFLKRAQDEEPFCLALIKQSQTPEFRDKMLNAMNLNEQRQLVDEIIAKIPRNDGSTEMATYTWVANLLRRFKFTPEQFLSLTHLYLQQNPVQSPSF